MYYDALRRRVMARKMGTAAQTAAAGAIMDNIAPAYLPLHEDIRAGAHDTYILPGGRGSGKSSFLSLELVQGMMQDPEASAIVLRRVFGTMRDSVFSQVAWAIDTLGVSALWRGSVSPLCFTFLPTGQQVIFRGLDDPQKLKSIKAKAGRFKFVWIEELSELTGPRMLRSVLQSLVRGGDAIKIFQSYNPPLSRSAWVNQYEAESAQDSTALVFRSTYLDIPAAWLGEKFIADARRLQEINPAAYQHEYLGLAIGDGSEVFPNIEAREITQKEIDGLYYIFQGLDFGFSQDPAAFIRMAYVSRTDTLYFLQEIYSRGLSNTELADRIKAEKMNDATTYCDSAEPKSIADLRFLGINAKECYKRQGSVRYGVRWLQHRKIVIDKRRTPNAYREFTQYQYKRDRDGNVLSDLPDENNHLIDAARYGMQPLIWRHGSDAPGRYKDPDVIEIDGQLYAARGSKFDFSHQ